jgi:hypothetical protein
MALPPDAYANASGTESLRTFRITNHKVIKKWNSLEIQKRAAGGERKQLIQLYTACREHSLVAGKYK